MISLHWMNIILHTAPLLFTDADMDHDKTSLPFGGRSVYSKLSYFVDVLLSWCFELHGGLICTLNISLLKMAVTYQTIVMLLAEVVEVGRCVNPCIVPSTWMGGI